MRSPPLMTRLSRTSDFVNAAGPTSQTRRLGGGTVRLPYGATGPRPGRRPMQRSRAGIKPWTSP